MTLTSKPITNCWSYIYNHRNILCHKFNNVKLSVSLRSNRVTKYGYHDTKYGCHATKYGCNDTKYVCHATKYWCNDTKYVCHDILLLRPPSVHLPSISTNSNDDIFTQNAYYIWPRFDIYFPKMERFRFEIRIVEQKLKMTKIQTAKWMFQMYNLSQCSSLSE